MPETEDKAVNNKTLQFLTSQSLWSRGSKMLTHTSKTHPDLEGSNLQVQDF